MGGTRVATGLTMARIALQRAHVRTARSSSSATSTTRMPTRRCSSSEALQLRARAHPGAHRAALRGAARPCASSRRSSARTRSSTRASSRTPRSATQRGGRTAAVDAARCSGAARRSCSPATSAGTAGSPLGSDRHEAAPPPAPQRRSSPLVLAASRSCSCSSRSTCARGRRPSRATISASARCPRTGALAAADLAARRPGVAADRHRRARWRTAARSSTSGSAASAATPRCGRTRRRCARSAQEQAPGPDRVGAERARALAAANLLGVLVVTTPAPGTRQGRDHADPHARRAVLPAGDRDRPGNATRSRTSSSCCACSGPGKGKLGRDARSGYGFGRGRGAGSEGSGY